MTFSVLQTLKAGTGWVANPAVTSESSKRRDVSNCFGKTKK